MGHNFFNLFILIHFTFINAGASTGLRHLLSSEPHSATPFTTHSPNVSHLHQAMDGHLWKFIIQRKSELLGIELPSLPKPSSFKLASLIMPPVAPELQSQLLEYFLKTSKGEVAPKMECIEYLERIISENLSKQQFITLSSGQAARALSPILSRQLRSHYTNPQLQGTASILKVIEERFGLPPVTICQTLNRHRSRTGEHPYVHSLQPGVNPTAIINPILDRLRTSQQRATTLADSMSKYPCFSTMITRLLSDRARIIQEEVIKLENLMEKYHRMQMRASHPLYLINVPALHWEKEHHNLQSLYYILHQALYPLPSGARTKSACNPRLIDEWPLISRKIPQDEDNLGFIDSWSAYMFSQFIKGNHKFITMLITWLSNPIGDKRANELIKQYRPNAICFTSSQLFDLECMFKLCTNYTKFLSRFESFIFYFNRRALRHKAELQRLATIFDTRTCLGMHEYILLNFGDNNTCILLLK